MPVKKGDRVRLGYEGSFDDGTVFETSEKDSTPLEFVAGEDEIVPGLDKAVIGMEKGEEKKVRLSPAEGYGEYKAEYLRKVPRKSVEGRDQLKPGMTFVITMPEGVKLPLKITDVSETEVTVDLNHPLAGKTLNFKIKILDIIPAAAPPEAPQP
jgi:FKBP-type peptidyl-prolyl cis-trans isomerase 2